MEVGFGLSEVQTMKTKFEIKCVGVFLHSVLAYLLFMPVAYGQVAQNLPFEVKAVTAFDEPWAMAFLSDGRMLVTEKKGSLLLVDQNGRKQSIRGVPDVAYGGQGGLGDVVLHPDFETNGLVYLSLRKRGMMARAGLQWGEVGLISKDAGLLCTALKSFGVSTLSL